MGAFSAGSNHGGDLCADSIFFVACVAVGAYVSESPPPGGVIPGHTPEHPVRR